MRDVDAFKRLQVSLPKPTTVYFSKSVRLFKITYLIGDLWLWRVLLFPLGAMCLLGLCAAPCPLTSPDVKKQKRTSVDAAQNKNHTLFLPRRDDARLI